MDFIWTRLLGQPKSVHCARWPTAEPVDQRLLASSAYFADALHEFRLRLRTYQTVAAKKVAEAKGATAGFLKSLSIVTPTDRATHATIFVARSLPKWQQTIVDKLRELYEAGAGTLPENKAINEVLQRIATLGKHSKKIMPFVQSIREAMKTKGAAAFACCHEVDELSVLRENAYYLQTTLDLDGLEIVCVSDESEASLRAYETRIGIRNLEETLPGTPIISFRSEPALALSFVNTQPRSGFIELHVPVRDGDSLSTLFARMIREDRRLRARAVSIFAFRDILSGPRVLPTPDDTDPARNSNNRFVHVTAEPERAKLSIDMSKGRVELVNGDATSRVELGTQLVYVVS